MLWATILFGDETKRYGTERMPADHYQRPRVTNADSNRIDSPFYLHLLYVHYRHTPKHETITIRRQKRPSERKQKVESLVVDAGQRSMPASRRQRVRC